MRLHKKLANTVRPNKKRLKMHSEVGKDRASLEMESMTKTVHLVAPFKPYFPLFLRYPLTLLFLKETILDNRSVDFLGFFVKKFFVQGKGQIISKRFFGAFDFLQNTSRFGVS